MKETVPGENGLQRIELDLADVDRFREVRTAVRARAQLVWGEHCTECTYPDCYSFCAGYAPRPDLHCRRFDNGIEAVRVDDVPDALMRIRFRKWGKLEAEGPTPIVTPESAQRCEALRISAANLVDRSPLPWIARVKFVRALGRLNSPFAYQPADDEPTQFVLECVGQGERDVPFTLTFLPKGSTTGLYQQRIVLRKGYTRIVVALERIRSNVDLTRPFLVQIEPLEESPPERFVFGLVDFVATSGRALAEVGTPVAKQVSHPAVKAKCVVWDLDNTVWSGTLGESGIEGVIVRPEVIELIRVLDARGILHSISSKNDESEALAALAHFGLTEWFLNPQIGWGPKSTSLQRIAQLLDIGLDTLAFVDDQPFERSEVFETLGCVTVFSELDVPRLAEHPIFDVPVTAESAQRRLMYRQESQRHLAFESSGTGNYEAFLRTSEIRLELSRLGPADITRIFELSQRTNQVNISGARYERGQVEALTCEVERLPIVMRCADRFGEYGVIGFALFNPQTASVEDFFMSCRVQRKFVEHALFQHLVALAEKSGKSCLRVRYRRTDRNQLALRLLSELGFSLNEEEPGVGWLERSLEPIAGAGIVHLLQRASMGSVHGGEALA